MKATPSTIAFVKKIAKDFGINLTDEEAKKHTKILVKNCVGPNGSDFYAECKEYFNN